jgi:hypothetical protein
MKTISSTTLNVLTLAEIAAWQIADDRLVQAGPAKAPIVAGLPALQRGAVWKTQQVEEVWDSLVQGFPVGAFLVSPVNDAKHLGSAALKYQEDGIPENTHYLLDGQQRATAIALGHLDLWRDGRSDTEQAKGALWVDLAAPPHKRDVEFVFRALTKAHPWGYTRDYQRPTLHLKQIRQWLNAFSMATGREDQKISDIRLKDAWPWDAIAPIPFAFLLLADKEASPDKQVEFILEQLKKTAFWSGGDSSNRDLWHLEQQASVMQALTNPKNDLFLRFQMLMADIRKLQGSYGVPVQILDISGRSSSHESTENNERPDPVETLFVRINSKGTPLEGEELNLRAWPLEANRADSDSIPSRKLTDVTSIERHYEMKSETELRNASFIDDKNDWLNWQASATDKSDEKYLLMECEQRIALVRAMTSRFVRIYAEWYQSLHIGDLMGTPV